MESSNTSNTQIVTPQQESSTIRLRPFQSRAHLLVAAFITVAVTVLFFSFYCNRYAGLRSGNGSFNFGMTMMAGIMPYRDFFNSGPPFNGFLSWAVLRLFGEKLIAIRAFGVFERVVLALILFFWLVRLFRITHAMFATIIAIVVSTGDLSDTLSAYNFEAILFFLLAGFAAMLAFERRNFDSKFALLAVASGVCAATSFATKQTIGFGATVAIPLMAGIYLFRKANRRNAVLFLVCFSAGWLAVCGAILLWLAHLGAVQNALDDLFRKGPAAKASRPSDFAVRAFHATGHLWWQFLLGCLSLALVWPALRNSDKDHARPEGRIDTLALAALCALSILLGAFASYQGKSLPSEFLSFTIFFASAGCTVLLIAYAIKLVKGTLSEREAQLCFLTGISFTIVVMLGLSWPVLFGMIYPALGLMVALVLNQFGKRGAYVTYGVGALVLCALTCDKLNHPQGFHEFSEPPVRLSHTRSTLPELQGMLLPATTAHFIDATVRIIKEHSSATDTIFVYPELGIFYDLTRRRAPTVTQMHNIDVVSDEFARSEAQRLIQGRPAVIVYYRQPAWALRSDERQWRRGRPSGQRDLMAAVETLGKQYHLAASFDTPPNDFPVVVYVRR